MASPLILKIQTQLDSKGFLDFKRGLDSVRGSMIGLGKVAAATTTLFQNLGNVIGVVFSGDQIRRLARLGIELETSTARLESFLAITRDDAVEAAESFNFLTSEMTRNSVFAKTDLLNALRELSKGTQSTTRLTQELALAQELAAANGVSVAQAAIALQRAQAGSFIRLRELTGIDEKRLEVLRSQNNLVGELVERFEDVNAVGRQLDTVAGQFARIRNTINDVRESLALTFVLPPLRAFANVLETIASDTAVEIGQIGAVFAGIGIALRFLLPPLGLALTGFQAYIFIQNRLSRFEAEVNNQLREQIRLLELRTKVQGAGTEQLLRSFSTLEKEEEALTLTIRQLREDEELLLRTVVKRQELANLASSDERNAADARLRASEQGLQLVRREIRGLEDRNALLRESQRIQEELGELEIRQLRGEFQELSTDRAEFERRRVEQALQDSAILLETDARNSDQRVVFGQLAVNRLIELENLLRETKLDAIDDEIGARRRLQHLLSETLPGLDDDATDTERSRQRDRIIRLSRDQKEAIEEERDLRLSSISEETDAAIESITRQLNLRDQLNLSAEQVGRLQERLEEVQEDRRRRIADLDLDILRQRRASNESLIEELEIIGQITGRRNELELAERRRETLLRQERQVIKEIQDLGFTQFGDQSLLNQVSESINRQVEALANISVDVSLNFNRPFLVQEINRVINDTLSNAGFDVQATQAAPSGGGSDTEFLPGIPPIPRYIVEGIPPSELRA